MKTHVETHHHTVYIQKSQKEGGDTLLSKDKFKRKCECIFTPYRASIVTTFFRPAKKPKRSGSAAKEAPDTVTSVPSAVVEVGDLSQFE